MRRINFLVILFLLASNVGAQAPRSQQSQGATPARPPGVASTEPKASVEGMVVKQAGSEPLKKARLVLRKAEGREPPMALATGADGKFTLREIEPGRYRLSVERNGFVRQEYGQRAAGAPGTILTLTAGQRLRDVTFKMIPSAAITGRVYDEDGEPLAQVQVQTMRYGYFQGQRQLTPAGGASTNDLGEYRIYGLAPGRYYLSARYSQGVTMIGPTTMMMSAPGEARQDEAYVPSYYPGTPDASRAVPLDISGGEEIRGIDFTFVPTPARRVRGRVLNSITGQPGRGANIQLVPREGGSMMFMMSSRAMVDDAQGNFELRGVTPGSYTLIVAWFEDNKMYTARQSIEVGATDVDGINIVIAPGVDVSGRVVVEGGQLTPSDLRVTLAVREGLSFVTPSGTVRTDLTFTLPNVGEETYRLSVFGLPPEYFLKSVRLAGEELVEKGVAVSRGQAPGTLEVVVSAAGARVEGLVVNADQLPVNGAQVTLVPEPPRRQLVQLFKTTTTDQFGRFTLRGVAPGAYKVFAWEEIEPGAHQDPEFLRPHEERGVAVTAREGGSHTVEAKVIPAQKPGN